uniref:Uncharacterized protein n=1 Tax=Craspedostauros australis TaxID=1486917 RepID=A0A7R9ZKQ0_9STRA|mmetsp:Transcript_18415/g.51150  ORF Transcript_18415/g.51150 Transcript_18415/m.51150 type:complete len:119 (+) Transcript_18415:401-757(+)
MGMLPESMVGYDLCVCWPLEPAHNRFSCTGKTSAVVIDGHIVPFLATPNLDHPSAPLCGSGHHDRQWLGWTFVATIERLATSPCAVPLRVEVDLAPHTIGYFWMQHRVAHSTRSNTSL